MEGAAWGAHNVPGFSDAASTTTSASTTTTSVPADNEGALPKRPRLEEDDFDPASATPAKNLDYSEVPVDDEIGGFNAFFYFFKCNDPTDTSKALFIKHNEIPLLLKKGMEEKCYIFYATYESLWSMYTIRGVYVGKDEGKTTLKRFVNYSKKGRDDFTGQPTFKKYRDPSSQAKQLWPVIGSYELDLAVIDKKFSNDKTMFYAVLFYMAVKYPEKCLHKDAFTLIYRTFLALNANRNKKYYDINIAKKQEEIIEIEQRLQEARAAHQRMMLERFSMPLSAKIAYTRDAHPEDNEIKASAEELALSKVYMQ